MRSNLVSILISIVLTVFSLEASAVSQYLYQDWLLVCKSGAEEATQECMIMTESDDGRTLRVQKNDSNNLVVIVSDGSDEFENPSIREKEFISILSTEIKLKAKKGVIHQVRTKPVLRDNGLIEYISGHGSFDAKGLFDEMKRSKSIAVNVSLAFNEFSDSFSLVGFSRAYDEMMKRDVRNGIIPSNDKWMPIGGDQIKKAGIGWKESAWRKLYSETSTGLAGSVFNEKYLVRFSSNGYVQLIEIMDDLLSKQSERIDIALSLLPSDAIFIKEYDLAEGLRRVRLYRSDSLKNSLPKEIFTNGDSGDVIIIYDLTDGAVNNIVISLGHHP